MVLSLVSPRPLSNIVTQIFFPLSLTITSFLSNWSISFKFFFTNFLIFSLLKSPFLISSTLFFFTSLSSSLFPFFDHYALLSLSPLLAASPWMGLCAQCHHTLVPILLHLPIISSLQFCGVHRLLDSQPPSSLMPKSPTKWETEVSKKEGFIKIKKWPQLHKLASIVGYWVGFELIWN